MLEKKNQANTPSWGLYPEFDTKTMTYKDMHKLNDIANSYKNPLNVKRYIEMHAPQIACELTLEEASGIPLPKKDDFDWGKITNREIRAVLVDFRTQQFLSNTFILSAGWKSEFANKWLFNLTECQQAGRSIIMRTDWFTKVQL